MRRVNRRAGVGSLKSSWTGNGVSSYTNRGPTFKGRSTGCSASPREPKCAVTWIAQLRTLSPINPHSAIVLRRVLEFSKESGNADGGPSTGPDCGALRSDQGERGQLGRRYPSYGRWRQGISSLPRSNLYHSPLDLSPPDGSALSSMKMLARLKSGYGKWIFLKFSERGAEFRDPFWVAILQTEFRQEYC
jgi:hypothetical protein